MTASRRDPRPEVEDVRTALRELMVVRVRDLIMENQGRALPLRLYTPAGPGPYPVLMFFHGGGWVTGDLDTHDGFCRHMCEWAGCAVVAVDYARPPEHRFPAAVEDCCAATQWIIDEGPGLGLLPSRMAVAGGGSGGGLAAVVSQWALARGSPRLAFQLLLYPLLDCLANNPSHDEFAKGPGLTGEMLEWYIEHYIPEGMSRADPRLSPVYAKTLRGLPPALVITSGLDVLRDEGRQYARQLKKADVLVQHKEYTDMPHGFVNYPARYDPAKQALLLCTQVLQEHLHR
ncbi:alpha/beta hydrolase fold domain-containing protein [Pseudomonas sp. WJP1]|uniref:alpha/beta hydrolase n=1 Tax=Pseudomonas sp. WJP1 TaxID=2986947 RepID=UPI00234A50BD|nr:alpha/beta hydrolase fold domain-containing protein [Pseudomonas sp. WJP1]WCM48774.1 alpha/beta hydrolase fold domain-containing protein [Pseudomonas sp. WJP1]